MFKQLLLFAFCINIAVLAANIDDVRRAAIRRLETQVASIKELADKTSKIVEETEGNISVIGKHEREYGDGVFEATMFQITKNAKSAYMLTRLMNYPNEVYRCVETREREAKDETNRYYREKFLNPGQDYENKAIQLQRDQIKSWKDEYYKNIQQYGAIYDRSVSNIKSSNSESYINSLVKQFDQTTEQMGKIITSILSNMSNTQVQILRILDNLVTSFQEFSRARVVRTYELINKCFPKSFFDQPIDLL